MAQAGPLLIQPDPRMKRQRDFAERLMAQGTDTSPAPNWLAGAARAITAMAGAYQAKQLDAQHETRQTAANEGLMRALEAGKGWQNPDTQAMPGQVAQESYDATAANVGGMEPRRYLDPGEKVGGGYDAVISALEGQRNPDLAPYAMQMRMGQFDRQQKLADMLEGKLVDRRFRQEEKSSDRAYEGSPEAIEIARKKAEATRLPLSERLAVAQAGSSKIQIGEEKEEAKAVGKYYGEQFGELQKAAASARNQNARIDRLGQLLDGVETGKFTGATTEIKAAAKSFGIDLSAIGVADDVAPAQAARALANEMALQLRNPAGGAGMPGALSDKDREFLVQMLPGLETTTEGRKMMLETMKRLNDRNIRVAEMARQYRQKTGRLDEAFESELQAFADANPVFAGLEMPKGPTGGPQARKVIGGKAYVKIGDRWYEE